MGYFNMGDRWIDVTKQCEVEKRGLNVKHRTGVSLGKEMAGLAEKYEQHSFVTIETHLVSFSYLSDAFVRWFLINKLPVHF